jgi:hypothetical protein
MLGYKKCEQARVQSNVIATFTVVWTGPTPFPREPAQTDKESRPRRPGATPQTLGGCVKDRLGQRCKQSEPGFNNRRKVAHEIG